MKHFRSLIEAILVCTLGVSLWAQSSYSDFVDCVESATNGTWGATCTLPGNQVYDVDTSSSSITVGRAPLTIQGSGVSSGLRRAAYTGNPNYNSVITIPGTVALVGSGPYAVTIQNLTFDGNRANQCWSAGNCMGYGVSSGTYVSNVPPGASNNPGGWASETYEINVGFSTQAVPVTVSNISLISAAGIGIQVSRGDYLVNNVTITDSHFGDETSGVGCAYETCIQAYQNYPYPYNPVITYDIFYGCGGAGVSLQGAVTYPQVMVNQFIDNMREVPWSPFAGGQALATGPNVTAALIYDNYLDGNFEGTSAAGGTQGLEINGTNHTIESNTIINQAGAAVFLESVTCAQLVSNTIYSDGGYSSAQPAAIIVANNNSSSADVHFDSNAVHDNPYSGVSTSGLWVWTNGVNGMARIDYSANATNGALFYNNSGGSVYAGSVASSAWNSSNCSLP